MTTKISIRLIKINPCYLNWNKTLQVGTPCLSLQGAELIQLRWMYSLNFFIYSDVFPSFFFLFSTTWTVRYHPLYGIKKTPRINQNILQRPCTVGGMALPNFMYYHWAANIRALLYWMKNDVSSPDWTMLEKAFIGSTSPRLYYVPNYH